MKFCICLLVLLFIEHSYGAGTQGEVKACVKQKADACAQQCKTKIPSPINADKVITCVDNMKQTLQKKSDQCETSVGVTDSSPCTKIPTWTPRSGPNWRQNPNAQPQGGNGNPTGQNRLKRQNSQNRPASRPRGPFPELTDFNKCIIKCNAGVSQSCTSSCTAPFDMKLIKCIPSGPGPRGGGRGHGPIHGSDGISRGSAVGETDTSVQGGGKGRPNRQATEPESDWSNTFATAQNCLAEAGAKDQQSSSGNSASGTQN